ncbi:DUF2075 domain-containing protein [Ruania sp. N2-46]|uniref:DUF2075 domain-containing protein n=2 Tax=Occultella gossypii TaxID=2800820 RepID=A0ABS7S4Y0_9MICO|nr:DUF2075 domain-containing protein [Occultella gossypii]
MPAAALDLGGVGDFSPIEEALENALVVRGHGAPSLAERKSWRSSLPVLGRELVAAGLGDVEVILEYPLPLSSKRADVVLAGQDPATGGASYVVVELKQWSSATAWGTSDTLVEVDGAPYRPSLHPLLQVRGYREYLQDFVSVLGRESGSVSSLAYLHNATDTTVADLWRLDRTAFDRMFTGQGREALRDYLRTRIASVPRPESARELLASKIAPSKQLLSVAAAEIQDREQFVLLDEQRVAYELVLDAVEQARADDQRAVVVVTGSAGSGKSVIALSLLGELARRGVSVLHATGSKSFTETMRQVAGRGSSRTKSLFKYFNSFMTAEPDSLEVVVLDEAHRIRAKSVNRYTPKALRENARHQVEELLAVAKVPVFLLDEHQVVRPGEMGTVQQITEHARARGMDLHAVDLNAQFRSGGSTTYLNWVHSLLGLAAEESSTEVPTWHDEPTFAVEVVASVEELEGRLRTYAQNGLNARMTAGYCWPWSDPRKDGSLVPDVRIGAWSRPWNLKSDRAVGGAPPSSLWASDPAGFDQVGCVYTAQGFEYAWNGVILGPDLVWRSDRWVARREFNKDPEFRSRTSVEDATFDRLVRHVYKVLLTRGLVGTLLYSVDEETQAMLRSRVNPRRRPCPPRGQPRKS